MYCIVWCFFCLSRSGGLSVCLFLYLCCGQLFSGAHGVVPVPRLIRKEKDDLLKFETSSSSGLIRPHPNEVKYITEWSGLDAPLFNPACIVDATGPKKGEGLCITRFGGRCFMPEVARKPVDVNRHYYYGFANYTLGADGHQVLFQNLSAPLNVTCIMDGHPRWFYFKQELYIISWSEGCGEKRRLIPLSRQESWHRNSYKNWIWKFGTNQSTFLHWDGYIEDKDHPTAKNFLLFQHQEKLMAIVSTTPHRVYQIDASNGNMTLFAETPGKIHFNDVGLTAGPVPLDDRRLLVAAHIRAGRRMFFYTCEAFPPFNIIEQTPLFYFTGESKQREKRKALLLKFGKNLSDRPLGKSFAEVEYGVQMQIFGEDLLMSMGIDDCDAAVITVKLSTVTAHLHPLGWMEEHGSWAGLDWIQSADATVTASSS